VSSQSWDGLPRDSSYACRQLSLNCSFAFTLRLLALETVKFPDTIRGLALERVNAFCIAACARNISIQGIAMHDTLKGLRLVAPSEIPGRFPFIGGSPGEDSLEIMPLPRFLLPLKGAFDLDHLIRRRRGG